MLKTVTLLALSLIALVFASAFRPALAAPVGSPWGAGFFPNLPVISQDGVTHQFYDDLVKDKIVIINFMFTNCQTVCPLMTSRMAEVRRQLGDRVGKDIFIYSITVDPENDTSEVLKDYADAFDTGPGWLFLTGKKEDLFAIRAKFGERSITLSAHRTEAALGNDATGEWTKLSAFEDYEIAVKTVLEMDPNWRAERHKLAASQEKPHDVDGQAGKALFIKGCSSCHSIGGGDRIGPDLKGVVARRPLDWLTNVMMMPDAMRANKDPLLLELMAKYKNVKMPNIGLAETDAKDLIAYLAVASDSQAQQSAAVEVNKTAPAQ